MIVRACGNCLCVRQRVRFACFGRNVVCLLLRRLSRTLACRVGVVLPYVCKKARVHVMARAAFGIGNFRRVMFSIVCRRAVLKSECLSANCVHGPFVPRNSLCFFCHMLHWPGVRIEISFPSLHCA